MFVKFGLSLILLVSAALPSLQCHARPSHPGEEPIRLIGSRPLVSASVNGSRDLSFLIDTGYSGAVCLDSSCASDLGLPCTNRHKRPLGLSGGAIEVSTVRNLEIEILGRRVPHQDATVIDLAAFNRCSGSEIDGIIGWRFLRRFVLEIDYRSLRIDLHDSGGYQHTGSGVAVKIEPLSSLPVISGSFTWDNSSPSTLKLLIDTGAHGELVLAPCSHPFIDAAALEEDLIGCDPLGGVRGLSGIVGSLVIGKVITRQVGVKCIADDLGRPTGGFNGLLGGGFLAEYRIILDDQRGVVVFHRGTDMASESGES